MSLINIRLQNKLQFYKTYVYLTRFYIKKFILCIYKLIVAYRIELVRIRSNSSRSCTQPLRVHRSRMRRRIELGCVCPVCRCIRFILNSTSVVSRPPVINGVFIYKMWTLRVHLSAIKSSVQSVLVHSVPYPVRLIRTKWDIVFLSFLCVLDTLLWMFCKYILYCYLSLER